MNPIKREEGGGQTERGDERRQREKKETSRGRTVATVGKRGSKSRREETDGNLLRGPFLNRMCSQQQGRP